MSDSPSPREERLARNEALFRQVNERIAESQSGSDGSGDLRIICECSEIGCEKTLLVPRDDYERVRGNLTRFLVHRGHVIPTLEGVVETHATYVIVEKHAELEPQLEAV